MKKLYNTPALEISALNIGDIITSSIETADSGDGLLLDWGKI